MFSACDVFETPASTFPDTNVASREAPLTANAYAVAYVIPTQAQRRPPRVARPGVKRSTGPSAKKSDPRIQAALIGALSRVIAQVVGATATVFLGLLLARSL